MSAYLEFRKKQKENNKAFVACNQSLNDSLTRNLRICGTAFNENDNDDADSLSENDEADALNENNDDVGNEYEGDQELEDEVLSNYGREGMQGQDISSLACVMVHLVVRRYVAVKCRYMYNQYIRLSMEARKLINALLRRTTSLHIPQMLYDGFISQTQFENLNLESFCNTGILKRLRLSMEARKLINALLRRTTSLHIPQMLYDGFISQTQFENLNLESFCNTGILKRLRSCFYKS
uniref:Uncharacterized protein n=1 Tax=Chenopodium quinoa TaxID=63459 RepID=A0A803LZ95_CHEQI